MLIVRGHVIIGENDLNEIACRLKRIKTMSTPLPGENEQRKSERISSREAKSFSSH